MNTTMYKPNIMIVDDKPENLKLLSEMLKDKGYRIRTLPSGNLALKAVEVEIPDLILLDINMPGLNGYEVCEILKNDIRFSKIPVIFLSALSGTDDKVKAFQSGGVDYVSKPFQIDEVNARIETHLSLRNLQLKLENQNKNLEEIVREQVREISEGQMATILAMTKLAEQRDDDTGHHIDRTSEFCRMLAKGARDRGLYADKIDDIFIDNIFHASPLHDIGKVAIPDAVLLKPGKLTPEEFEIMKTHTNLGARYLNTVLNRFPKNSFIKTGVKIAISHHEKWNGSGYPVGTSGSKIQLEGRIMAIADVYDALRSKRVYKDAFSHEKSRAIILEGRGSHFDPNLVDVFMDLEKEFDRVRNEMGE
ncbi:MAG TPA: response regulator [bacterium]|nr:response regulator [bacterium]HPS30564.1 response regulator [bacterium]